MCPGRDRIVGAPLVLAVLALLPACTRTGEGTPGTPDRGTNDGAGSVLRVGNPSRGADEQPDYEGFAAELRARMAPRMPLPKPTIQTACAEMLDGVAALYERVETDAASQLQRLKATHARDLAACEAEATVEAAFCVTLSIGEEANEWPWMLDQCMRAFPKPASP